MLLSARELCRVAIFELRQMHHPKQFGDFLFDLMAGKALEFKTVRDVLPHRHVRPDGVALKNHRHIAALRRHQQMRG